MIKKLVLIMAVSAAFLTGCGADDSADPDPAPNASATPEKPVELQSAELQSLWWTWAALPSKVNPVQDTTGARCGQRQPAKVWLVAGSFGSTVRRRCTVPDDRPIAGPVVNLAAPTVADCRAFNASAKGTVMLDGKKVAVTTVKPVGFEFTAQAGNPSGYEAGRLKAVGCGLWFTVPPLAAGKHTLVIRGTSGDFSVAATYDLISTVAKDV